MTKLHRFALFAAGVLCSTVAFAGEARLNTDSRGCYLIEVRSFDIRPTRVSVNYKLAGLPDQFYVDLQPQESRYVTIAKGACLHLGDIKIGEVSTHVINPNGTIGSEDLNKKTPDLIEEILRRNQAIDRQNNDLLERRRLAREARKQRELELKAARERNALEVQRIFALGRDQQLQALRRRFPRCIINLGYTPADIALCSRAEILEREDKVREARLAEERAEKEALLAANAAKVTDAKALHDQYLALAQGNPCWAVQNYAKYHPIPETYPPTVEQIRAGLEATQRACDRQK